MIERAVINSGPLVALSLVGRADLLFLLFQEFWIPEAVYHEVAVAGLGRPGADALADARYAAQVRPAPEPDPLLIAELDVGEAAVIALARSCAPCLAIIDEKRGRRTADVRAGAARALGTGDGRRIRAAATARRSAPTVGPGQLRRDRPGRILRRRQRGIFRAAEAPCQ